MQFSCSGRVRAEDRRKSGGGIAKPSAKHHKIHRDLCLRPQRLLPMFWHNMPSVHSTVLRLGGVVWSMQEARASKLTVRGEPSKTAALRLGWDLN